MNTYSMLRCAVAPDTCAASYSMHTAARRLAGLLATVPVLTWSPAICAAAAVTESLEEIVITAERRPETVQKSSLAIQVVGADELVQAGVSEPKDLGRVVPGMQVGTAVGGAFIFIRGVGDASSSQTTNPGVSFNVDGVNFSRPDSNALNFFDLERVEVLKGPQGTLYGRNAVGGAVNLITRKPDFSRTSGYVTLEAGNYGLAHGTGAINLPASNTFAVRGAFDVITRDGYLSNGTDDDKHEALRLSSHWRPSDAFSMLTTLDYARKHGMGSGSVIYPRPPGSPDFLGSTDPRAINYIATQFPSGPAEAFGDPLIGSAGLSGAATAPPFAELRTWGIATELTYDMGWASLTVLPAYRELDNKDRAYLVWQDYHTHKSHQLSSEVRLNKETENLKWVAGAYYFHEAVHGTAYLDRGTQITVSDITTNSTDSLAGFAQATYSVLKDFRVIAGARYTADRRKLLGSQVSQIVVALPPTFTPIALTIPEPFEGSHDFNAVTWKAGVEYDLTPDNMLFLTASTGFKSGGINNEPAPNSYEPEKLTAYELGLRNRFFDNRLQMNLELFKWDYKDHQEGGVAFDTANIPNFLVANAGSASLYGFNLDIAAKVTAHDTFKGMVEYNHSRYDSFLLTQPTFTVIPGVTTGCKAAAAAPPNPTTTIDCSGLELARAPKWAASASWEHVFPLPNGAELSALASAQYVAARWGSIDFVPITRFPSYTVGDFDLTYTSSGERWSVSGFVRNIGDKIVPTGTYLGSQPSVAAQSVNPPRTYGGRITVNF